MADGTKIEWTDMTWNVVNGCSVVSPGCKHCYAMKQAHRFPVRQGLTEMTAGGMVWTGEVRFNDKALLEPLRKQRPRRIFVCAHGDLFHEKVPDEWIDRVFAVMALSPQHTFQVLTKRPERMRAYLSAARAHPVGLEALGLTIEALRANRKSSVGSGVVLQGDIAHLQVWPLPNVWLGVSVEDQQRADERIPILLDTPAAIRWLSCEPLLGPVDLSEAGAVEWQQEQVGHNTDEVADFPHAKIDWIVAGGESGAGARPMHPDWARSLRDQCAGFGVPFLFKQWGAWLPGENLMLERPCEPAKWQDGEEGVHQTCRDKPDRQCPEWRHFGTPGEPGAFALRVGKKAAGRELDGVLHDGYPA